MGSSTSKLSSQATGTQLKEMTNLARKAEKAEGAPKGAINAADDLAKTSKGWSAGKVALATGVGVSGIWLLPQLLSDSCDRSAQQMGLPAGSCGYICVGGCSLMMMMSVCMVMMMFMTSS